MSATRKTPAVLTVAADAEFLAQQQQPEMELHRSHRLRLQTEELLQETSLTMDGTNKGPKWASTLHIYLQSVQEIVTSLSLQSIKHDPSSPFYLAYSHNNNNHKKDVEVLHKTVLSSTSSLSVELPSAWDYLGLTTAAGNAHVVPTFTVWVRCPNDLWGKKDYLRHRYFQVSLSNICVHIYKQSFNVLCI
jgi:hypothetical protein